MTPKTLPRTPAMPATFPAANPATAAPSAIPMDVAMLSFPSRAANGRATNTNRQAIASGITIPSRRTKAGTTEAANGDEAM